MADTATTERLKAIDAKLGQLNDHVLTTLTAHGVRHDSHTETLARHEKLHVKAQADIILINQALAVGKVKIGYGERVSWMLFSAVVATGVYYFRGG